MLALLVFVTSAVFGQELASTQEWWRTAVYYQIYPRSFMDSDGDGVGDIKGIISKLDYFKEIGVNAIWLSSIYTSPMVDFGYDISNFYDIDPVFGSLEDFKCLLAVFQKEGIRVIMDYVPNHTSNEHPWFKKSIKREEPYTNFFIWKDAIGYKDGKPIPPNNWLNSTSGSAWEWNNERQQFYFHQFYVQQPDLNYRNTIVVEEMNKVFEYWLNFGIDGIRVDAIKFIVEDEDLRNEPKIDPEGEYEYDNLDHIYTNNWPKTLEILRGWSDIVKQKNEDGKDRVLLMEVYDPLEDLVKYYGGSDAPFTMPFNFHFLDQIGKNQTATALKKNIEEWLELVPDGQITCWATGNHDTSRVATRAGEELADTHNMILAMLPGSMVTYYGEEICMTDAFLRYDETLDPNGIILGPEDYLSGSRDPQRTPMQWDDTAYTGFSTYKPWLPINPNYWRVNVKHDTYFCNSHLRIYKQLTALKLTDALLNLNNYVVSADTDYIFTIKRWSTEDDAYYLIVNFGNFETSVALPGNITSLTVEVCSVNSQYTPGDYVTEYEGVKLRPKAAVILSTRQPLSIATKIYNIVYEWIYFGGPN